jgi:flagellar basal-body rod protein FlgF
LSIGIWPAVSGAMARSQEVDTIANNLANSDTVGFKRDAPTFREYLAATERENLTADIPRGPITDKDLHPLDGRDQSFVIVDGTYTDMTQGHLRMTHSPLDVALQGTGFLEVSTPEGVRYTRQGSLKMATDGQLVNSSGHPVLAAEAGGLAQGGLPIANAQLGQGGLGTQGGVGAEQGPTPDVVARYIYLDETTANLSITDEGEIYADDRLIGRLNVVELQNPSLLRKEGTGLLVNSNPENRIIANPRQTKVHQGMLETSNVNPVREMTDMIKAQRSFQQSLKAIQTYDQLLDKEANEIGRF